MSTQDAGSAGAGGGPGSGGDKSTSSGTVNVSTGAKAVTSLSVGGSGTGGGGGGGQLSATAVVGGGGATVTTTTIPIDLASASKVLVRPEKTTMPTTTYRFGSAPGSQMRVVIPSSAAQQTFYRQPANIKQDATTNRTQISTLPAARTVTQNASLTVSRAPQTTPTTVSYHVSNRVTGTPVVAANLQATTRATINGPIRISTPPIQVATNNNTTTYVQRQPPTVVPSRSVTAGTATAATIISQSSSGATTTLVPNFQMSTPLFRAGTIGAGAGQVAAGAPRARVVTQTTLSANHHQVTGVTNNAGGAGGGSTVVNNVVTPGGGSGAAPQAVAISSASGGGATVASSGTGTGSGQSQALVATLSAVLQGPRQVSTLLYTNNSNAQQYTIGPNQQRLALATTLSPQRPQATVTAGIRPTIQRLPTAGIRVSTGSLNFRSPMLASTTVLTTIASSTGTVGTVTNTQQQQQQQQVQQQAQQQLQQQQRTVTATGTPAGATAISNAIPARIIQVQNPPSGTTGTAQIVNRLQTNLLNIQPLIVSNSRLPQSALQPGITIAQVGKLTQVATAGSGVAGNDGSGGGGNSGSGSATTTTLQTASGQQIVVSTGGAGPGGGGGGGGGGSPATTAIIAGNLIAANHPASQATHQGQITQIVNVNAGQPTVVSAAVSSSGQQQQPQIVTVSQASGGAATAGTVIPLPLALTSARNVGGAGAGSHSPLSIVTGGIVRTAGGAAGGTGVSGVATSIGSVLPIAKVTPQQQQTLVSMESGTAGSGVTQHYSVASSGGVSGGPSLYIQTRPGGAGLAGAGGKPGGATGATLSVVSSGPTGAGGAGSGTVGSAASTTTFLPTSTFYYERLTSSPATSVPSSTGAVTISSTGIPVSSSTFVQAVAASSSSSTITTASAISGPVFSIPAASSVINSSGGGSGANTTVVTVAAAGNPTLAPYGSTGSFAIVQASPAGTTVGARTTTLATGPVHGIVPASVQTGSAAAGGNTSVAGSIVSVSQPASSGSASSTTAQIVPIRFHSQMLIDSSGQTQQIIVSSGGAGGGSGSGPASIMPMIPVGTSGGTTTVVTATSKQQSAQQESPQSSILRKRTLVETASGTIKATPVGKDLTAALMAVERERSVREQQEAQLHLLQQQQQQQQQHHHLVAELRDLANASPLHLSRPPSTDGSTTVSATSSPGLDEQEEEELRAQAYANRASNAISGDGHFKPVQDEHHFLQQQQQSQQQSQQHHREIISLHCTESFPTNLGTSTTLSVVPMANHTALVSIGGTGSSNGGAGSYEQSPRKKARKQLLLPMTDGHHHHHLPSVKSNSSSSSSSSSSSVVTNSSTSSTNTAGGQQHPYLGGPDDERMDTSGTGLVVLGNASSGASSVGPTGASNSGGSNHQHNNKHNNSNSISTSMNNSNNIHNNNNVRMDPPSGSVSGAQVGGNVISVVTARQNLTLRKPHNISMLQSYKQTWKSANNHFQRYTDVKQREERRPTVMDIANQSHILQKVNGWKIYHLSAQIEDLSDLESQAYGKLEKMLRAMESSAGSNGSAVKLSTDVERINELLKGNMQRSKIIIDGINDARTQIMKIFQHKPHVSDIILRCASKRNFKKREKT